MEMGRLARCGDLGVVVEENRDDAPEPLEDRSDLARHEIRRIINIHDRERRHHRGVGRDLDRAGKISQRLGAGWRRDTHPGLDFAIAARRAAAFLDRDSRNQLAARIVEAIPFAGRPGGEDDVRAGAVLDREAHYLTLLVFEHPRLAIQHRDQRDGKPRAGRIALERLHRLAIVADGDRRC